MATRYQRSYLHRILIIGLITIGIAIYLLSNLLTFKFQLVEIKGVIQDSETYVSTVTEKVRGTKSQKSELIFSIYDRNQIYRLIKNIGNDYRNEEFENLLNSLKKADSVSIWIKKTELDSSDPKVFQIDVDQKTVLQFEKVRTENGVLFLIVFVTGISFLLFYFSRINPDRFHSLFRRLWPKEAKDIV
ncbi:hypothetical protein [Algoriphagus jejuensis]|uniref:hypothetical protein n=1 Tax=Algoriphagus jejuensis TaxID=419934 RepID=UPI0031CFF9F4